MTTIKWGVVAVATALVIVVGLYFSGIWNGPPPCKHLIGFHVNRHGDLTNVYGPCGHDDCGDDERYCG